MEGFSIFSEMQPLTPFINIDEKYTFCFLVFAFPTKNTTNHLSPIPTTKTAAAPAPR